MIIGSVGVALALALSLPLEASAAIVKHGRPASAQAYSATLDPPDAFSDVVLEVEDAPVASTAAPLAPHRHASRRRHRYNR